MSSSPVVPALDERITRFSGRGVVAAQEIIDVLLDLRLIATLNEIATDQS